MELNLSDIELLKPKLVVGDVLNATIIKFLGNNKYLVRIKGFRLIAESALMIQTKHILVRILSKRPKLKLKLLPVFPNIEVQKFVISTIKHKNKELDLFDQYIYSLLNHHKFELLTLLKISSQYKQLYSHYDGIFIFDFDVIVKKLSQFNFSGLFNNNSSEEIVNITDIVEQIDIAGETIYSFVRSDETTTAYQFVIFNERFGKFNCILKFIDSEAFLNVFVENSFAHNNMELIEKELKEIFSDESIYLLPIKIEHINKIITQDRLDNYLWKKIKESKSE